MRILCLPVALLAFALCRPASADSVSEEDKAAAVKELVKQGTAEYMKKNWEAARVDFLKAWELKQHYAIAGSLAQIEMKLGRYRDAAEHLKYAIANLPPDHADKRAEAEASLKECRAHLSSVRVAVSVAGATVRLDGHDLPVDVVPGELLIEPGPHRLEAEKTGYLAASNEFLSAAGEVRDVKLELAPQQQPGEAPPTQPSTKSTATASGLNTPNNESSSPAWILVSGGAATVVAVGFGTYFTLHGSSLASDATRLRTQIAEEASAGQDSHAECAPGAAMRPTGCDALLKNSRDREAASTDAAVSWVAAGALGIATVAAYLLWPKGETAHEQHARVSFAPWLVGARGGAVRVEF